MAVTNRGPATDRLCAHRGGARWRTGRAAFADALREHVRQTFSPAMARGDAFAPGVPVAQHDLALNPGLVAQGRVMVRAVTTSAGHRFGHGLQERGSQ